MSTFEPFRAVILRVDPDTLVILPMVRVLPLSTVISESEAHSPFEMYPISASKVTPFGAKTNFYLFLSPHGLTQKSSSLSEFKS